MSYSTCRQLLNKVLLSMGCVPIGLDSDFSNLTRTDNYQRQGIIFLEIIQRRVSLVLNSRFMQRRFVITTNGVDTEYQPDAVTQKFPVEGFKQNSFFNVTANGPANGPISVIPYTKWREAYPRPDAVGRGFPQFLVPLPADGTDQVKVILFPYPSGPFLIEGIGRIDAPDITDGAQEVIFPKRYEHILIYKLKIYLEQSVNEGRQLDWALEADEIMKEIERDAIGAVEEVEQLDLGIRLWSNRGVGNSARDYNSLTDTVNQYP